jgi:UDP-N-acetylmuramate dehydrogenase
VQAVDILSGKEFKLSHAECAFAYRDSVFKRELRDSTVVTSVDLALSRVPAVDLTYPALINELDQLGVADPGPAEVFAAVVGLRRRRLPDPNEIPNAGSFFKNPIVDAAFAETLCRTYPQMPVFELADNRVKIPAAWLIDQAGWKGHKQNGLGVHQGHALVLVNCGNDSGADLLQLAEDIVASVHQRFGLGLEMEPRIYGAVGD